MTADFVIAQPPADNTLTGGYLYNRRVIEHQPAGSQGLLVTGLDALPAAHVLVLDSLYLDVAGVVGRVRAARPGARVAWLLHGLPHMWRDGGDGPSAAEQAQLAAADALVAPGGFLPRLAAERGVTTPAYVCAPGVDAALAAPGAVADQPPVVLTVATVTRAKGLDLLCDALARLPPALAWRWRVVGDLGTDPGFVAELRARVAAAGLGGRVELTGARPPAAVVDDYRRAALFVLPSRSENSPLTLREAHAAGLPVVASRVGGVAELVEHGADGLLVAPGDVPALAAALERLLGGERAGFAARARARGRGLPDWPAAAAAFARTLHALRLDAAV